MIGKTILVCLDTEENTERLLRFASNLALRGAGEAVLVGTHATPVLPVQDSVEFVDAERHVTDRIRTRFLDTAHGSGIEPVWETLSDAARAGSALRQLAQASDLVVMPQPADTGNGALSEAAMREVVTGAGRPVLMLPRVGDFGEIGRRLLIGWSPTREATRAVHDALTLVPPGSRATLLWVSQGKRERPELERSAQAMAMLMRRHGVETEVTHWQGTDLAIGDVILNESFERDADLIVTGAYGHSRLYDMVIGATTTHLLSHMTAPVLFAH